MNDIVSLVNALVLAVQGGILSREEAKKVLKGVLTQGGLLTSSPVKDVKKKTISSNSN